MVIIYILRLDTCVQLIYIPPQQGKLRKSNRGVLVNRPKSSHLPLKRYITVRKADRRCHGAHYTVSSWNHHLVSFGDLPLRQFLTQRSLSAGRCCNQYIVASQSDNGMRALTFQQIKQSNALTFAGELDNIDRILMQTELTVIAGDHESYKISAKKSSSRKLSITDYTVNFSPWPSRLHQHCFSFYSIYLKKKLMEQGDRGLMETEQSKFSKCKCQRV